jgi:hypothetical protein
MLESFKMPVDKEGTAAVLLDGISRRYEAVPAHHIFPIIKAQNSLEIGQGDQGMKGDGDSLGPGFVIHRYKIRGPLGKEIRGFPQFGEKMKEFWQV